ncbi:NADH dehydrogenase [ubiquinone] 1 alpha subcomplex subunit 13-like [Clavelina lepadiformis]|uniref:NADH dehydrogenase [ubiquinone] 1 alpha subcomplex subunit 13 n=1 Tax=Clavelina lepadiformis TaxID=159417 RepID=A0ABP0FG88_CLALP
MSSTGWKNIKYRQDLPPPGGYGAIPYKRNLPVRGPSGFVIFGLGIAVHGLGLYLMQKKKRLTEHRIEENRSAENCLMPILEAEKDRQYLRFWKEQVESEALNIVGSGYDLDFKPGLGDFMNYQRFDYPLLTSTSFFDHMYAWYNQTGIPRCGP